MHDRFYIAGPPGGNIVELDRTQSRHVTKALRKRRGDVVTLFDGRGVEYDADLVARAESDIREHFRDLLVVGDGDRVLELADQSLTDIEFIG